MRYQSLIPKISHEGDKLHHLFNGWGSVFPLVAVRAWVGFLLKHITLGLYDVSTSTIMGISNTLCVSERSLIIGIGLACKHASCLIMSGVDKIKKYG